MGRGRVGETYRSTRLRMRPRPPRRLVRSRSRSQPPPRYYSHAGNMPVHARPSLPHMPSFRSVSRSSFDRSPQPSPPRCASVGSANQPPAWPPKPEWRSSGSRSNVGSKTPKRETWPITFARPWTNSKPLREPCAPRLRPRARRKHREANPREIGLPGSGRKIPIKARPRPRMALSVSSHPTARRVRDGTAASRSTIRRSASA